MTIDNRAKGELVEECRLSLSQPALAVKAGHAVQVTLAFKNEGATDISFPRMSLWHDYDYTILYNGQLVPFTQFGERMLGSPPEGSAALPVVTPGQEMKSAILINRLYDMSLPGRYLLVASKEFRNRKGTGFMKVISNQIAIDVVED